MMNTKMLNTLSLIGSILVFVATFMGVAVNGDFAVSVLTAGGIWYLLPLLGLAGIVASSMALGEKMEIKIAALIVGGLVLALSLWFGIEASALLNNFVALKSDMSNGFNSSFFTGKQQDVSNLVKSSFGIGFYMYIFGAILILAIGLMTKSKPSLIEKP